MRLNEVVVALIDHAEALTGQSLHYPLVLLTERHSLASTDKIVESIFGFGVQANDALCRPLSLDHGKVAPPIARQVGRRQPPCCRF